MEKQIEDKRNELGEALEKVDELKEEIEEREDEWERRYERMQRRQNVRDEAWRICVRFMKEIGLMKGFRWWLRRQNMSRRLRNLRGWPV